MRTEKLLVYALVLTLVVLGGAFAQEKYVPKPDEELYGTWTNIANSGDSYHPQRVVVTADGYTGYSRISDPVSWLTSAFSRRKPSEAKSSRKLEGERVGKKAAAKKAEKKLSNRK